MNQQQLLEEAVAQLTRIANALEGLQGVSAPMAGPGPTTPPPEPPGG